MKFRRAIHIVFLISWVSLSALMFNNCSKSFQVGEIGARGLASDPSQLLVLEGKTLYTSQCASCHGAFESSTKKGKTADQIVAAIGSIPSMKAIPAIAALSPAQIEAISASLNQTALACNVQSVGTTPIRRLNNDELTNSLSDILKFDATPFLTGLTIETGSGKSGFLNDAAALPMELGRIRSLVDAIKKTVDAAIAAPNSTWTNCPNGQNEDCVRQKLPALIRVAYRRAATTAELDDLTVNVFRSLSSLGYQQALSGVLQVVFLSPKFLFVTSFSGGAGAKGKALSQQELATRLSLMLWGSLPDVTLLDLADRGLLKQQLREQIVRLMADPRVYRGTIKGLFAQWIDYTKVLTVQSAGLSQQLKNDMYNETDQFLRSIVAEDLSLMTLVKADYSFLNANLANHYGIAGVTNADLRKVPLGNSGRQGIASHGSLLNVHPRIVGRGHFISDKIMCETFGDPPANATQVAAEANLAQLSPRAQVQFRISRSDCTGCHSKMDPIGLSLETFNSLGQFQSSYADNSRVDSSGTLFGQNFTDYISMANILKQRSQVRNCLAKKVLTFAINRSAGPDETCAAQQIATVAVQDNSRFSDVIYQIVINDMFNFNVTDSQ